MEDVQKYICNCGKEFDNKRSLIAHGTHCNLYIKKNKNSKYKIKDNLYKCECGKEFNNYQSLNGHFGHCTEHCNCLNKKTSHHHKGSMQWEKLSAEQIKENRIKAAKTKSKKFETGELIPSFKNKHHNPESLRKIRESTVEYLKDKGGARYSLIACEYLDKLNERNGWNLQHAKTVENL
ncbi:hypothetical protein [uncultured Methanobrevibacter sp.]|uniref:hypothetical protein n=1 Tax=uncultured Methanobrevibacter sp. TaxID=253161 RepID=UPI0025D1DC28|nr:hypothetical protein [uncultured Methanobrevibacter sp.]